MFVGEAQCADLGVNPVGAKDAPYFIQHRLANVGGPWFAWAVPVEVKNRPVCSQKDLLGVKKVTAQGGYHLGLDTIFFAQNAQILLFINLKMIKS